MQDITASVKEKALELGFDDCRIASVDLEADDGFDRWLNSGCHADMDWMVRTRALRQQVRLKVPGAASVVVLAKNHHQPDIPPLPDTMKIACYARRRDYHRSLFKPLKRMADFIRGLAPGAVCYASTDSGPVRERVWAARAGMGWIGRHGLVIHPRFGTWFHLATVLTTIPLDPDEPMSPRCGSCTTCIDACPTGAIIEDRMVDSRRCIAYHTIENPGAIPGEVATALNGWVFGCDICQEACPWNRRELDSAPAETGERRFPVLDAQAFLALDEATFMRRYAGTPLMRTKYAGMCRNVRLARGEEEARR